MLTENTLRKLKAKSAVYRVADNGRLCIEVRPNGKKYWRYRYRFAGRATTMSLGECDDLTLAAARYAHAAAVKLRRSGKNPTTERKAEYLRRQIGNSNTFEAVASDSREDAHDILRKVFWR